VDLAVRWAEEYRQVGATEYLREFEELTQARVLLASGQPDEALALLDKLLAPANTAGRMGSVVEIEALRALALQAHGEGKRALDSLRRALVRAEPEGYVRTFVDDGAPMRALLGRAAASGMALPYVARLLAAFDAPAPGTGSEPGRPSPPLPPVEQPLAEPLTGRELEVLHLLGEGLSNAEIGHRLVISLPTVKSHTRNIYGKLGVHNRREAVARARRLEILPS
jgi:LuxR family maltose regulon positive regulatory protein